MQQITYSKSGDVLCHILDTDLRAAGIPIIGVSWSEILATVRVDYGDEATPEQITHGGELVAAHVPIDPMQQIRNGAEIAASNIPNWAHWTETEADAWYQTNVRDPFGAAATLVTMKVVIGTIIQVQWATIRLVIALRNQTWPQLQNPPV